MNQISPELQEALDRDTANGKLGQVTQQLEAKADTAWVQLAEFGLYYGWDAIRDVRRNALNADEFMELLKAARVVKSMERYNGLIDNYIALAAVQPSKDGKAGKVLTKTLRDLEKQWK